MDYEALACDFDETLAHDTTVANATLDALRGLRASGRKLILVTGRELDDLLRIFPHAQTFDRLVAENGGVLHDPEAGQFRSLGKTPPRALVECLRHRGVEPLSIGQVILATREPHQEVVLEVIHELGLEYHIIFNKGAVMILPSSINKATGLKAALKELQILPQRVVGIGDAENDHAFLELCGFSAAVANALPSLKRRVHLVTQGQDGAGVVEVIGKVLNRTQPVLAGRGRA